MTKRPVFKPLGDRVLCLMDPQEDVSAAGIIMSAGKPPPQNHGTVVAVGPGNVTSYGRQPMSVKKGDRILWSRWHSTDVDVDGVVHRLFSEDEIFAVLDAAK